MINGEGYMTADLTDVKAQFGFSPTFVQRQNVQGDYGDNQQDFWLTWTQRDWSLGEDQKYYRQDDERARRYYSGKALDVRVPGFVGMRHSPITITTAATPLAGCGGAGGTDDMYFITQTNLYRVDPTGVITDKGAHGLTVVGVYALATDGTYIWMSDGASVRSHHIQTGIFAAFSATGAQSLAFLNNTLYGFRSGVFVDFVRWDAAGVMTTINAFKTAQGASASAFATNGGVRLVPFGGKLLLLAGGLNGSSLWVYDGVGVALMNMFESAFVANDLVSLGGIIYISGAVEQTLSATTYRRSVIYFIANGAIGQLWKAEVAGLNAALPPMCTFDGGLVFYDSNSGQYTYYDPATGGISRIGQAVGLVRFAAGGRSFLDMGTGTTAGVFPGSTKPTQSTIVHSEVDFDSSLPKVLRSVKVEWDAAADGDGGSVDIQYELNKITRTGGSYTILRTGAVSGTEYPFVANTSCQSVSIRIILNKGTSTDGPVLKRVSLRAVPVQQSFRKETFILNLTGRDGDQMLTLRNNDRHVKDGLQMASDLRSAAQSTTPISITDEFGTFTGVIEMDGFQLRRVRREEYIAVVPVREV